MPRKFVTQREIAKHLGLTPRRVRQLERAGIIDSTGAERLYDLADCHERYRAYIDRDLDRVETELMRRAQEIEAALAEMASVSRGEARLRVAKKFGRSFEAYDGWLRMSVALWPHNEQEFVRDWANLHLSAIFREGTELLDVRLASNY